MAIILQCPLCRNPLLNSADGYQCANNHAFDAAREGYVNLLLVNKKHSREPGDSKEMIRSRRRFLDLGLYNKISDRINEVVAASLHESASGGEMRILDAGCGEGFYMKRLSEFLASRSVSSEFYGVDISKFAVRSATQRDRSMNWFVANNKDLPFAASSFEMVLNVFSPADFAEFSRVLRQPGHVVIVTPGPRHLNGLREIIYPNAREHAPSTVSDESKDFFILAAESRINYQIELKTHEAIMDLLSMTPYFWNIDLKTKAKFDVLDRLAMDVEVEIQVLRKK